MNRVYLRCFSHLLHCCAARWQNEKGVIYTTNQFQGASMFRTRGCVLGISPHETLSEVDPIERYIVMQFPPFFKENYIRNMLHIIGKRFSSSFLENPDGITS